MNHHDDLTPQEQELFEMLKAGAVMKVNEETGESEPMAFDDVPVEWRECIRISRKSTAMFAGRASYKPTTPEELAFQVEQRQHRANCPSCIESGADSAIMDADWWAMDADHDPAPYPDGTRRSPEQAAVEIYTEAADDFERAASIREARGQQDEAAELRRRASVARQLAALVRQALADGGQQHQSHAQYDEGEEG
jgi:hypothetical protein